MCTQAARHEEQVARRCGDGHRNLAAIEHLVADLAVTGVVEDDDCDRQLLGGGRRELGDGEQKPTIAAHPDDLSTGRGQRRTDRDRHGEAESAEARGEVH